MLKTLRRFKNIFIVVTVIIFFIFVLSRGHVYKADELEYGVTFSKKQAEALGFDWQAMYKDILDDLGVKKIRLSAYWDEIEKNQDAYAWSDLDWQIEEASKRNVDIILAIGGRLPRWPECHFPDWYTGLSKEEQGKQLLEFISTTIYRYKDNESISAWQIENEPFLSKHFGECPVVDKKLLDQEIDLARKIDKRPIIVTDSGELSFWIPAAKRADIFGTTMYLNTYSKELKRYIHYPITPGFFRFKKNIAQIFAHPKKWIVIEMQAEPWGPNAYQNLSQEDREKTMSLQKFRDMLEFGRQSGFKEFYLWGAEYWYWEKYRNNNEAYWLEAKQLFL